MKASTFKMNRPPYRLVILLLLLLFINGISPVNAQLDSIFDQGMYRKYIVHLPAGYDSFNSYPLVINIHGLNSDAAQQQSYSQFDAVADTAGFIVVYPDSYDGSWHYAPADNPNDLNFVQSLVDSLRAEYSINNCLFATGMSFGGFFSYKLACSLDLKAVAVVSGNFTNSLLNTCSPANPVPLMHFHGTADPFVNYNGTIGIPPVDTTVEWWVEFNHCTAPVVITNLPNLSLSDSTTVTKYYYGNGDNGTEVTFFKILNGGHTWPGATPVPPFGYTNADINASNIIGDFFSMYCNASTSVNTWNEIPFKIYPNPFSNYIFIEHADEFKSFTLFNSTGIVMWQGNTLTNTDFSYLAKGLYVLRADSHFLKLVKD